VVIATAAVSDPQYFRDAYMHGGAYRSKADSCPIILHDVDSSDLPNFKYDAAGNETQCVHGGDRGKSGSLDVSVDMVDHR
jgi:hypothetical protein